MINVQYIVVRRDIIDQYGIGFLAAQICHASMAPVSNQLRADFSKSVSELLDQETADWLQGVFIKYVYEVADLHALQNLMDRLYHDGIKYVPIEESKINQLTCIGLKPYNKGRVAPYFKALKRLGEGEASDKHG